MGRMVLAEKGSESRYNGLSTRRRVPSPSSNGHATDDSSSSDDSEHGMRVGSAFQATIPPMIGRAPAPPEYEPERAVLVWSPRNNIPDHELDEYISISKEKYGYNAEQALGMLCWHKFDLNKALADLPNFTPFPDDWTVEDKVLFEQAFQFHDKHFHKIKQMLPDKSIASLVKYYYSWKKTRTRSSLMDKQARRLQNQKGDGSDGGSEPNSDNEGEGPGNRDGTDQNREKKNCCVNCYVSGLGVQLFPTAKGPLCKACHTFWKKTGMMRTAAQIRKQEAANAAKHPLGRSKNKPPRGMYLPLEDLKEIASGPPNKGDAIIRTIDAEVIEMKRRVQNNKQIISQVKHKLGDGIDHMRPSEANIRINARWTNEEMLLAVQAFRKYGRDMKSIAEVIGNKTEAHVRSFYANHCKRFDLDNYIREYEEEHGIQDDSRQDVENIPGGSGSPSPPSSAIQVVPSNNASTPSSHPRSGTSSSSSSKSGKSTLLPPNRAK